MPRRRLEGAQAGEGGKATVHGLVFLADIGKYDRLYIAEITGMIARIPVFHIRPFHSV
jgi:hypothetical protein